MNKSVKAHLRFSGPQLALLCIVVTQLGAARGAAPLLKEARLDSGVALHYVELGTGETLIFVHGSLSDYTYWEEQVPAFAEHYHVIDYSRRYNQPNNNPPVPNYSAVTDAEDLAGLIRTLHLTSVNVIGHSYGALAALFLADRHPELVHKLVLAEPPVVSLLEHIEGADKEKGKAMLQIFRHAWLCRCAVNLRPATARRALAPLWLTFSMPLMPGKRCQLQHAPRRFETRTNGMS